MNGFADATTATAVTPDPAKHVKYNLGMVLGVDDFNQEFAYLLGRDQALARDLIGYGTVCGLQVTSDKDANGWRVVVSPGVALNPRGQIIRVTSAQCAYLNDWLNGHRDDLTRLFVSPLGKTIPLYVTLCYRECPTDQVPIPGEPCRTETEATVASRLSDDFQLDLRFAPPDQTEEDALRDFVAWLGQIPIGEGVTTLSLPDFIAAVRASGEPSSPLSPPDFMYGSPPAGIEINHADACEYLSAAFRIWVTELRPRWRQNNCDVPAEDCVFLAALHVPLVANWQVDDSQSVVVDETRRPYLVHLRMLQEWVLCGRTAGSSSVTASDSVVSEQSDGQVPNPGTAATFSRGDHTHGTPLAPVIPDVPAPGSSVTPETAFGQAANAGAAVQYSRADHTHGTPPAPVIPDVPAPGNSVTPETAFGQAANAGADVQYSRADHTHGTPPAPVIPDVPAPGNTVTPETAFGQAANAGAAVQYSRADHTHGTPPTPVVAAGQFDMNGNPAFATSGLGVKPVPQNSGLFFFTFNGFKPGLNYVVKGTGINTLNNRAAAVFEIMLSTDPALIKVLQTAGLPPDGGMVARVISSQASDFQPSGFMVEISQY